jgi:hypothetical protein
MPCPNCHQDAPTIVRDMRVYCSACGAPRPITTAVSAVNVAGQTARVGGNVASVLGVMALVVGGMIALVFGAIANWIWGTAIFIVAPILLLTLLVALPLLFGGRSLNRTGQVQVRAVKEQAVFALAARQRGTVTVRDVARALAVREEDADALLTELAKRPDGRVTLELDDNGGLSYLFHDLAPGTPERRVRVADQPWQAPPQRTQAPGLDGGHPQTPGVRIGEAPAAPPIIDAELIDEEVEVRGERAARR